MIQGGDMKKNYKTSLTIVIILIVILLIFSACKHQEKYVPSSYSKDEVQRIYFENNELFDNVVRIVSSNEEFYEKGRINEYTDADIVSPYDKALSFFNENDKNIINEIFILKPYMILYDYARRFVEITFIADDTNSYPLLYTFLFWTLESENSEVEFEKYQEYLAQRYFLENVTERCIIFYHV